MRSAFALGFVVMLAGCGGSGNAVVKSGPMPENGTFTGVYFSPQYGEMHMVQNGNAVVGKYKKDERAGKIQGEVEGDLMRFEWTEYKALVSNRPQETRGRGYFKYMVDASNGDHLIKGRWGLKDDDQNGGEWSAYKSRKGEPDLEHFATEIPMGTGGENASSSSSSDDSSSGSHSGSSSGSGDEGDDVF
jgi:hypothetical protein